MKKKINILILGLLLSTAAQAQILMMEDEQNLRSGSSTEDFGVVPLNGVNYDQTNETYTPIGEGILLLSALGGAYLLKKKKKK